MNGKINNKVTDYIAKASIELQPILDYLREIVHDVYPDIEENIKWNDPSFEINGKIIISMMAFNRHINFLFNNVDADFAPYADLDYFGEKSRMKGIKHLKEMSQLPKKSILKKAILEAINK